ncbi:MAG: ABC transporter ATP-binding protein [Gemmatimonadetes bacterium]|nr:ABC transporter ATP-binding protein/permease [Gemmatimonadota bacterium]NNF13897.1 ABC transporter ATP-binding protein [Gemmatimonadota bacterium]
MLIDPKTARFILAFFRAYPKRTALMVSLLIVSGIAEGIGLVTLFPLLELAMGTGADEASGVTQAVQAALGGVGLEPRLEFLLALIVLAMTVKSAFLWLAFRQVGYAVAQVETDQRLRLIRHLLAVEWSYFSRQPTGHFANAISAEAGRASQAYRSACQVLAGVIQAGVYLFLVIAVAWQVVAIAIFVSPLMLFALKGFVTMGRSAGEDQTRVLRSLVARVTELIPGIKTVKAMGRERQILPFLEAEANEFNLARRRAVHATQSLTAFREPLIVLVLAVGLYGAIQFTSVPSTTVLVAAVIFYRVMTTLTNVQSRYQDLTVNESAYWSIHEKMHAAEEHAEPRDDGGSVAPLEHRISFRDVSFAYETEPVLRNLTFEIPARSLVAFVGGSGAGKTTLVDLLVGLLEPSSGEILIDDMRLTGSARIAWRRHIGYVPQEVLLFHDTVLRNVALEAEGVSREDVEWALEAAGALDFVRALPDGLDHVVGERGTELSGGQRQRISIARALVTRPDLLVLDEATTALDPETERSVCEALQHLSATMTIVAISHQPAITAVADHVFEVRGGQLFEEDRPVVAGASVGAGDE